MGILVVNRFKSFAIEVYNTVESEGMRVIYIFDCLTDLLEDNFVNAFVDKSLFVDKMMRLI